MHTREGVRQTLENSYFPPGSHSSGGCTSVRSVPSSAWPQGKTQEKGRQIIYGCGKGQYRSVYGLLPSDLVTLVVRGRLQKDPSLREKVEGVRGLTLSVNV